MLRSLNPKFQSGLVDCLWADCQHDFFAHTFPAGDFLERLSLGPSAGSFVLILFKLDIINVEVFYANL